MRTETLRQPIREQKRFRWPEYAGLLLALTALIYTAVRASVLSITHDEALTYLLHVSGSFREILLHERPIASNNHLLNTLLIKVLVDAFGNSEFVMRLPALLGHTLYLWASFRLCRLFLDGGRFVFGLGLLATVPFLLDFFSCARGYALGLGCSMWGLDLFLRSLAPAAGERVARHRALAVVMLSLAVLSNLAFANLWISVAAALMGVGLMEWRRRKIIGADGWLLLAVAACAAAALLLVYNPAALQRIRSQITEYGGTTGFWPDTVGSLVECCLYGKAYSGAMVAEVIKLVAAIACVVALAILRRPPERTERLVSLRPLLFWTGMVLVLSAGSITAQFRLFGTRCATDRSAIYLIPVFLMLALLSWESLRRMPGRLAAAGVRIYGFGIAVALVHNFSCLNLSHTHLWRYDAGTREVMKMLCTAVSNRATAPDRYRLGLNWLFEPSANYYRLKYRMGWLRQPDRRGPDGEYDFYYLGPDDRHIVREHGLRVIRFFPVSGAQLAVPR